LRGVVVLNKKGQLEIGVTIMVLLVFLVLLILALVVYFKFSYVEITEKRHELLDQKFSTLVNAVVELPEFKCSFRGAERECLDADKLIAFKRHLADPANFKDLENYADDFGIHALVVEITYPILDTDGDGNADTPVECTVSLDTCNEFILFEIKEEGLRYSTPVSIYYPKNDEFKIGKLIIVADIQ
jgi:Na+-transporting methylmalonyl-CoA/oxaloacetate decarboxylase gamma subunit